MSVITYDIQQEVNCLIKKVRAKHAAKAAVTNDERARFLGLYIDKDGNIAFPKATFRKGADQKSGAVRTSWPSRVR